MLETREDYSFLLAILKSIQNQQKYSWNHRRLKTTLKNSQANRQTC